jgi:hypothetical protein
MVRKLTANYLSLNKAAVLNNQSLLEFRKQIMVVE